METGVQGRRSTWLLLAGFLAALYAGYWISSVVGIEVLRKEVEIQLSQILAGPARIGRVGLAVEGGLFIQGEGVSIYPDPTARYGSRLFADRVVAEVDLLALATGRFRLSGLILEDPVFDIRKDAEGQWYPFPVQALAGISSAGRSRNTEAYLDFFSAFESVSRTLLTAPIAADRTELRRARILFRDESREMGPGDGTPVTLSLDDIDGLLIHHWLSGEAQLKISGTLRHGNGEQTPIEIVGENRGADDQRLRISAEGLDLAILDPYLADEPDSAWPGGVIAGSVDYITTAPKIGQIAINWKITDFRAFQRQEGNLEREHLRLAAIGQLDPNSIRLTGTMADDTGIRLSMDAEAARPLAESSSVKVAAELRGLNIRTLRQFLGDLGQEEKEWIKPLTAGRVETIEMNGVMRLEKWGQFGSGQLNRLPDELLMIAEIEGIRIPTGPEDHFSGLAGRIELRGDTLLLRGGRGNRNGKALPTLDLRINGFSNLAAIKAQGRPIPEESRVFAGIDPLFEFFGSDQDKASGTTDPPEPSPLQDDSPRKGDPAGDPFAFRIWLDHLDYPSLPWTIRGAELGVTHRPTKTNINAAALVWGDVPLEGNLTWINSPAKRLHAVLEAFPPIQDAPPADPEEAPIASGDGEEGREDELGEEIEDELATEAPEALPWVSGRVEAPRIETGLLPLQEVRSHFAITGTTLRLSKFKAALEPRGMLAGEAELQLDQPDRVPVVVDFSIDNADMSTVTEVLGMQPGDITGILQLGGTLTGNLRPETVLLDELEGRLDLHARQGELRREKLPLLLALAQASEGYNDYAERDSIAYESMNADMHLEGDRIVTRNFELEGPLRIYASGSLEAVHPPYDLVGVAGLFLFRGAGQILEAIPLVKIILPGSERGLVGAYYQVTGSLDQPEVRALSGRSFAEGLPDALEAPYQILRAILSGGQIDEGRTSPEEAP